jgi:type II secretory pathway pseudopilin PulG
MKTATIIRMLTFSLIFIFLGSIAMAQTKEDQAREKEMKAKQEQLEKQRQQLKEQQLRTEEFLEEFGEQARAAARTRSTTRAFTSPVVVGEEPFYVYTPYQENQSSLTLRNSFDGTTDSSKGEFDVNESTTHIRCTINGKVRSGKINVKVLYPNGKVFKDLAITSSAEISFSQSLTIKEEEKNKYVGSWTYEITADKAEGSYNMSFITQ